MSLQLLWSAAVLPSADGPESDADVDHDDVRKSCCSLLLSFVHALLSLADYEGDAIPENEFYVI